MKNEVRSKGDHHNGEKLNKARRNMVKSLSEGLCWWDFREKIYLQKQNGVIVD